MNQHEVLSTSKKSYVDAVTSRPQLPQEPDAPLTGPRMTLRPSRPKSSPSPAQLQEQSHPSDYQPKENANLGGMDTSARTFSKGLHFQGSATSTIKDPLKYNSEMGGNRLGKMVTPSAPPTIDLTADSPGNMQDTGLDWPKKTPKPLSYDHDPAYLAEGEATYAKEKAELDRKGLLPTTGNGLLDALKSHQAEQAAFPKIKPTDNTKANKKGIRAAIEAAALTGATRTNSGNDAARLARIAAFNAGKRIIDGAKDSTHYEKKKVVSKPIIPLDHDHSKCSSWLTYCGEDDNPTVIRPSLLRSEHHGMNTDDTDNDKAVSEGEHNQGMGNYGFGYGEKQYYDYQENGKHSTSGESRTWYETESSDHCTKTSMTGPTNISDRYQALYYPGKVGWSSSETWISAEEQERARWEKIKATMHHTGMNKSPFVPKTFKEYLELKSATTDAQQRATQQKLDERQREAEQTEQFLAEGGEPEQLPVQVQIPKKLRAISEWDGLTAVSARNSIWTQACLDEAHVDWPTLQEYKAEGDQRARGHYGRYLPLPRLRRLDAKYAHLATGPNPVPTQGPGVPREYRRVAGFAVNPVYDGITTEETAELEEPPQQLRMEGLNGITRGLIEDIDAYGDDDEHDDGGEGGEQV
ncbi:hypothetical protein F4779DRAFT_636210 [Xylariaceae sp. FL0662B]|nr:hypothetical protein F4779DRAFT_636210 [Xylariaceae sp. FL0662B]